MRGAPWLACIAVVLVILAAIPFVANAETGPEPREASPFEPGRPRMVQTSGETLFHFSGACADEGAPCVGDLRTEDGTFFLPSSASGGLVTVSWRPESEDLRTLRVTVATMALEGESPLRFFFTELPAGEHRVSVAPARRLAGTYDQTIDFTASFDLALPMPSIDTQGTAWYRVTPKCVLLACHGLSQQGSDELVLPWTAIGSLTATWDVGGSRIVCLRGTDRCAEGESPLQLPLDGLGAGSYRLDVRDSGIGSEVSSGEVAWSAFARHG